MNSIAQTAIYQLAKTDIRVNTICPGLIETGMTSLMFDQARSRGSEGKIGQLNPLGRYGLPQGVFRCLVGPMVVFNQHIFAEWTVAPK